MFRVKNMARNKKDKKKRGSATIVPPNFGEMKEGQNITLISASNDRIEVPIDVSTLSIRLNVILLKRTPEEKADSISLEVTTPTLRRIVSWLLHYREHPLVRNLRQENRSLPRFDDELFSNLPTNDLLDLVNAAHYMGIRGLMDATCKKIAGLIKGQTTEQMRQTLNITNDFTPEEEDRIRSENLALSAMYGD